MGVPAQSCLTLDKSLPFHKCPSPALYHGVSHRLDRVGSCSRLDGLVHEK